MIEVPGDVRGTIDVINRMGREGWEAFSVEHGSVWRFWFKRQAGILPLPQAKKPFAQMEIAEH